MASCYLTIKHYSEICLKQHDDVCQIRVLLIGALGS